MHGKEPLEGEASTSFDLPSAGLALALAMVPHRLFTEANLIDIGNVDN
jgi:hypothetical protein